MTLALFFQATQLANEYCHHSQRMRAPQFFAS
jgi:hypothetical protein